MEIQSERSDKIKVTSGFYNSFEGAKKKSSKTVKSAQYRTKDDCYVYSCKNTDKYFGIACKVISDGKVIVTSDGITAEGAKKTLLLIKVFSEEKDRLLAEEETIEAFESLPCKLRSTI